jgi:integrase
VVRFLMRPNLYWVINQDLTPPLMRQAGLCARCMPVRSYRRKPCMARVSRCSVRVIPGLHAAFSTIAEVAALMRSCADDSTPAGARDAALVALLRGTGMRRAEVVALDLSGYDPTTGALTVRSGKGRKRAAGNAMAFKLSESAQHRWRAVNSAHLVALVRAGAKFENGVLVERPDESTSGDTHAA